MRTLIPLVAIALLFSWSWNLGAQSQTSEQESGKLGRRGGSPNAMIVGDEAVASVFDGLNEPIAADVGSSKIFVQAVKKLPGLARPGMRITGGGTGLDSLRLEQYHEIVKPEEGTMFVCIVCDVNGNPEATAGSPGSKNAEVVWNDEIGLAGKESKYVSPCQVLRSLRKGVVVQGIDGLELKEGVNRIALVFQIKTGSLDGLRLKFGAKEIAAVKK